MSLSNPTDIPVIWVCSDCHLEYHYPGESPPEDRPRSELWSVEDPSEWENYFPPGQDNCGHNFDRDYDTPAWESHQDECETRDFDPGWCRACGTTLAGTRHAYSAWRVAAEY